MYDKIIDASDASVVADRARDGRLFVAIHNDSVSAIAFRTVDDVELLKTALEELIELGLNPRDTGPRGLHVKMQTGKRILVPVHEIVSAEKMPPRKAPRRKKRR